MVIALTHSTDFPMPSRIVPVPEDITSATARTVQMLARWAAKPRMAARTPARSKAAMINLETDQRR
jgi:hypothetical protein